MREAIEARGAGLRFLPPDSPGLNPIEQVFAQRKQLLRRAARSPKPPGDQRRQSPVKRHLHHFSAKECRNDLKNFGYAQPA